MLDIQVYLKVCELVDTALFILGTSVFLNLQGHNREGCKLLVTQFLPSLIAACAAARRAMGTRKGEQLT